MEISENTTRKLPAGWRKMNCDKLQELADDLNTAGEWELVEDVEAELENREAEDDEMGQHYDSPDIYDTLGERPSYAS